MQGAVATMERPFGRTVWRRAMLVAVPCVVAIAFIAGALITGALAMSFAVGGNAVTVKIGSASLSNLQGFPEVISTGHGEKPVLLANVAGGNARDVCIGVPVSVPILGTMSIQIKTGYTGPISFNNFLLNANALNAAGIGSAGKVKIGISTDQLNNVTKPTSPTTGIEFGSVSANSLGVKTFLVDAGSIKLNGLAVAVDSGSGACS